MTGILVDYDHHPAFQCYSQAIAHQDTSIISVLWQEIDRALCVVTKSDEYLSESFLKRYHQHQIVPLLLEILKVAHSIMPANAWFREVVAEALQKCDETFFKELVYANEKKQNIYQVTHSPLSAKVCSDLKEEGVSFCQFPQEYLDIIVQQLQPEMRQSEAMVAANPTSLHSLPLGLGGPYYQITNELLKAYGVLDGVTLFAQQPMEIIYVTLCLSCSSQNWFRDCYADVGVATSKLAYLHFDHDFDVVKVLMYLKPVTMKNGPFRIIPRSKSFIASHAQAVFFKHLDKCAAFKIQRERSEMSAYYRPVFKDPGLRQQFMYLPKELRGSSHFGDDILEDSSLGRDLLAREVPLLSETANCAVFSGSETLHRGGLTEEGQRWAFQIALRKVGVGCGSA